MKGKLLSEGGPHQVKDLGNNQYRMSVSIPKDEHGRVGRECPKAECSPGYFKIKAGTGIPSPPVAYCPYCKHLAAPSCFTTKEQERYVKDLAVEEAKKNLTGMLKDALGLGPTGRRKFGGGFLSVEMSLKPGMNRPVRRPHEDEVRRDVICPHCTLDQTVFGLAIWCADCGRDIFLAHVAAELEVVDLMLQDVERRKELLGNRVAAKDLENSLEDVVSIFEVAMKVTVRRALVQIGKSSEDAETYLKRLGNSFQSITRTRQQLLEGFGYEVPEKAEWSALATAFEKRHPIAHNLGVVDRKYLERAQAADREGREIRVVATEVKSLLSAVQIAIQDVCQGIIPDGA